MTRVTINAINAEIKDLGYEIVKGKDYFYFWPLTIDSAVDLYDSIVPTIQLGNFTIKAWRTTLEYKIDETERLR